MKINLSLKKVFNRLIWFLNGSCDLPNHRGRLRAHSIQSAKPSFPSSELGSPTSSPQVSVAPPPPPFGPKGGDTRACWGGDGGTQFWRRHKHSGTPCIGTIIPLHYYPLYAIIPLRLRAMPKLSEWICEWSADDVGRGMGVCWVGQ